MALALTLDIEYKTIQELQTVAEKEGFSSLAGYISHLIHTDLSKKASLRNPSRTMQAKL
jgi:ribosomal protein S17E